MSGIEFELSNCGSFINIQNQNFYINAIAHQVHQCDISRVTFCWYGVNVCSHIRCKCMLLLN